MNWRVGDIALCVVKGIWVDGAYREGQIVDGPENGEFITIGGVFFDEVGDRMLLLKEWPRSDGWLASEFKKIKPDTDTTEIETGLIAKIKGKQPVSV